MAIDSCAALRIALFSSLMRRVRACLSTSQPASGFGTVYAHARTLTPIPTYHLPKLVLAACLAIPVCMGSCLLPDKHA